MTKEEIFKDYTDFIELLANTPPLNKNDKAALLELNNKSDNLLKAMKGLNSCDADWFSDAYGKWHREVFYPKHKEKIEKLKALKRVRKNLTMTDKGDRIGL